MLPISCSLKCFGMFGETKQASTFLVPIQTSSFDKKKEESILLLLHRRAFDPSSGISCLRQYARTLVVLNCLQQSLRQRRRRKGFPPSCTLKGCCGAELPKSDCSPKLLETALTFISGSSFLSLIKLCHHCSNSNSSCVHFSNLAVA